MNSVKLALKPLEPLKPSSNFARTVNLYKKRTRDPLSKFRVKTIGWEERPVRIANAITWLLEHAKKEGLTPRKDGYVRVKDLLKHPNVINLDFPTIEKAVQGFRHPYLRLSFDPHNVLHESKSAAEAGCWWIGLQKLQKHKKRIYEDYADRRIIDPKTASGMVYRISSQEWPEISARGIPRGRNPQLAFSNDFVIPFHHEGDHTFIRVDSKKVHANYPLYNTRVIDRRAENKPKDIFTTPAPRIPPNMFEAVMRVAVERYPLILRNPRAKKKQRNLMQDGDGMGESHVMTVMKSGVDALRKFGFADAVERSGLETSLTAQQQKVDDMKDGPPKIQDKSAISQQTLLDSIPEPPKRELSSPLLPLPTVSPHL